MLAVLALTSMSLPVRAQTAPIPYYPWCFIDYEHNHRSCGYVSYQQCQQADLGGPGICFENTFGSYGSAQSARTEKPARKR